MNELSHTVSSIDGENIRRQWHEGEWYYSLIDIIGNLLNLQPKDAQNYYHVLKNHLRKSNQSVPNTVKLRAECLDAKRRLTDFTNTSGFQFLQLYLAKSYLKKNRIEKTPFDEVEVFHPLAIAHLQSRGWNTLHHVRLSSESIIDVVASSESRVLVVECKPELPKSKLYTAIGQVLCYCQEYDTCATPVIASYRSEFDSYTRQNCELLGIGMIEIEG